MDADEGILRKMRSKETEADYRYFREPDLLPPAHQLRVERKDACQPAGASLDHRLRFMTELGLPEYDAEHPDRRA